MVGMLNALRGRAVILALTLFVAALAALAIPVRAGAVPYPPTAPSSTAVCDASQAAQGTVCGIGAQQTDRIVEPTADPTRGTNSQHSETANTGFAALGATVIATSLLVGGLVLLAAGRRRRRHS